MVNEKLSLTQQGTHLSIHSRSGKGGSLYLVNITADGRLYACSGVPQDRTNFRAHITEEGNRQVIIE